MMRARPIFSFLIAGLVGLLTVMPALAVPPLPSGFYGTVKINGHNVPDGTLVRALLGGQAYAQGYTQTYQGDSVYSLDVPGDDSSTTTVEGGREGESVQFEVGGVLADQTGAWHTGTNVPLNLIVPASGTPVWTPVPPTLIPATATSTPTARPSTPTWQPSPTAAPPMPTQGLIPTGQPIQPISPSPSPTQTPAAPQAPSLTPATVSPRTQASSTIIPLQATQPATTLVGQPTAASRLLSTLTHTAVPTKQPLPTAAAPTDSGQADPGSMRLTGWLLVAAAMLVVVVGVAIVVGIAFRAVSRAK